MIDCQYELIYVFANANFGERYPFAEDLEDRQMYMISRYDIMMI